MPTQTHLPVQPTGAEEINAVLAIVRNNGQVAYVAYGIPVFTHAESDAVGQRLAAVQMMELGLARREDLSAALHLDRSTLTRHSRKVRTEGVLGVVQNKRGPKGAHRFTAEKRARAAQLLDQGSSIRQAAGQVGVTEGTIRRTLRRGELGRAARRQASLPSGPSERSQRAARGAGGVAVQRHTERALARMGQLQEAAPSLWRPRRCATGCFTGAAGDAGAGAAGGGRAGLWFAEEWLLRLARHAVDADLHGAAAASYPRAVAGPSAGELGVLLGLDRAPEVKTLRRKLWELTARQQAARFSRQLTQRWVSENAQAVGLLYVDGHVRPYHGTTHKLPKAWVARRRLCMPATTDIWVNQQDAQPLFVVSAEANDNLLAMLRREILPQVRELVGERRVTLAFDREGWSPKFFQEVFAQGFDVLTYRKGAYAQWPKRVFRTVEAIIDGRKVSYQLAERSIRVLPGFRMREVRRLCDNGHQTSIVTTRTDWPIEVVAWRMFERWTQENFFRYMRQHFALDALVNYQVEPADPERTIPNPERKALAKELRASRAALQELEQAYGQKARANPEAQRPTMRGFKIAQAKLNRQLREAEAKCEQLRVRFAQLPKRVPLNALLDDAQIVRLAPEAKHLTDTIKMLAFRAETALVRCLTLNGVRTEDDGRALVREMLLSSADIVPCRTAASASPDSFTGQSATQPRPRQAL
ncbi:MAG: helix-turn-helix domain-containing protein [Sterolibacteriaceae bacterium]|uniref:Helix-turn-helix domain-containing protein n=1 Tax=Candidatus Methylophosphatis roskildensis TaxID=2899263 RepID=A0A9D7HMA6_9PROT|nr:helix-turn-helix domain-containing protein [Candidatus Methylophosphatis roskildensis]